MRHHLFRLIIFPFCFLLLHCDTSPQTQPSVQEDYKTGNINVCIDESYQPIFEDILKVYRSSYPNVTLHAFFKSEADCIKNLTNDSFRVVILARNIKAAEEEIIQNKIGYKPAYGTVAYDAIAVITNKKNKDSLFTIEELRDVLLGKNKSYAPIVDGLSQSSVLRYVSERILKKTPYTNNLKGSVNSKSLIENVATHQNLIGFIGVSWVGDKEDSMQISFSNQIKIIGLPCQNCEQANIFVKPYQANLALNKYPFLREITYVLKENYTGPGRGFVNFLSNERGQLIFKRAYLVPAKINFNVRTVKLN